MDTSGRIWRECKCGEEVFHDRDCPKCGEKSTVANDLAELFKDAIISEIPDPAKQVRDQLIRNDVKRNDAKRQTKKRGHSGRS